MNEIQDYVKKVVDGDSLTREEAIRAFQIIMIGGATPVQIAALLTAMRIKGESVDEITGAACVLRSKCEKFLAPDDAFDTCGTGGDQSGSYNISTAVAFVLAGCGIPVAKHGNRAISSKSGSADVLVHLSVNVESDKDVMEKALQEANICFMMAPKFHKAMRHVAPVRQDLKFRTIFNILGPLVNPASTKYQLLGVYSKDLIRPMAEVLKELGTESAWVVHGSDGMDELTTTGVSHVAQLKEGQITEFEVNPEDVGLEIVEIDDLKGGDAARNAKDLRDVLMGKGVKAYRDIVLFNSAASLVIAGKAEDLNEGMRIAAESIDEGRANDSLSKLIEITN